MNKPTPLLLKLTVVAVAALAACSDDPASRNTGQKFLASIDSVEPRARPLAVGVAVTAAPDRTVTIDQLLAWAQLTYPDLFPGTPATFSNLPYQGKLYTGQGYTNGNYLAVANGEAWGLGPFTNQQLQNFGAMQGYADLVCSQVDCGRSGPMNTCTSPQSEVLLAGTKWVESYVRTGLRPAAAAADSTVDRVVEGPTTFLGQAVVAITSTTKSASGADLGSVRTYVQATEGGLIRTLAVETSDTVGGPVTRVVFDPPVQNSEFTIPMGQRLTKTESTTSTLLGSAALPVTGTRSTTYTFEARETINVQGRSYDTCRYREAAVGGGSVTTNWYIVGSGIPARTEVRDASAVLVQTTELKSGTVNAAPLSPGQASLDVASAERMVADYSYLLPICTPGGTAKPSASNTATVLRKAQAYRQLARLAAAGESRRYALAFSATKPADQLGECGGRLTYPSYSHVSGVTTATLRYDNYCTKDSDTGGTQIMNGSWSFVDSATPTPTGPVSTRYEASSANGISIIDKDAKGTTTGSQVFTVLGYVNTPGVPGGDATEAKPDRLQVAEWQIRNDLTAKTYRQTGYSVSSFYTRDGGEQVSISGRGYRSTGYYDLSTSKPLITDKDGNYVSGALLSTGANGDAAVFTVLPGEELQGTMTVGGKALTTAPACK